MDFSAYSFCLSALVSVFFSVASALNRLSVRHAPAVFCFFPVRDFPFQSSSAPPQFSVVFLFGCVLAPTGGCFFGLFSPIVGKSSSSPNNLLLANRFRCTVFRFCRFFSCPLLLFALFAPLPPQPIAPPVHRKRGLPAVRVERRAKKNLGEENNYIRVENGCLITGEKSAICRQENGLSVFPCI